MISLDTLPFWPWLWADPFRDEVGTRKQMAEKRLRVNYETARAPIPDQYALVHRADLISLMHEVWRQRALAGLLPAREAKLRQLENLAQSSIGRRRKVDPHEVLAAIYPGA